MHSSLSLELGAQIWSNDEKNKEYEIESAESNGTNLMCVRACASAPLAIWRMRAHATCVFDY